VSFFWSSSPLGTWATGVRFPCGVAAASVPIDKRPIWCDGTRSSRGRRASAGPPVTCEEGAARMSGPGGEGDTDGTDWGARKKDGVFLSNSNWTWDQCCILRLSKFTMF